MFSLSALMLILANLVPVYGVAFQGWSLFSVMLLYWSESAITGVFNVLRMLKVGGIKSSFMVPFFMMHYGIFMLVHLVFVITFFGVIGGGWKELDWSVLIALASLVLSHGFSYFGNFIGQEEYKRTSVDELMMRPYGRIFVMHLTIIFGGGIIMSTGASTPVILLMMAIKTIIDLGAHLAEHGFLKVPSSTNQMVLYVNGKKIDTSQT